jgi:hypothetical protein
VPATGSLGHCSPRDWSGRTDVCTSGVAPVAATIGANAAGIA